LSRGYNGPVAMMPLTTKLPLASDYSPVGNIGYTWCHEE
jgi:hypothetical protein